MSARKVHVLIVDDSRVAQLLLTHVLDADPQIQVIGTVDDGHAALEFVRKKRPDAVLMDIHMPGMDGFGATRQIMETHPLPIVICSAVHPREVATTFRALEAGALACVEKPVGPEHHDFERIAAHLRQTLKLMSEVKVVRRWGRERPPPGAVGPSVVAAASRASVDVRIVGIGASTGGPQVIQEVLGSLPKEFRVPILVVQHIAPGFLSGLADWLTQTTTFRAQIAAYGVCPLPGHVYLAPDDFHMGLGAGGRILLTREAPHHHLRPAVSYLFRTLAEVCGSAAIGVLLTGMGRDGASELKLMKDKGALTIAQNRESCVVYGMPGEAVRLGAATHVLAADKIADALVAMVNRPRRPGGQS